MALGPLTTFATTTATGTITVALGPVTALAITTVTTETVALGPLSTTATGTVIAPTRFYLAANFGNFTVDTSVTPWTEGFQPISAYSGGYLGAAYVTVSPDGRWLAWGSGSGPNLNC